MSRGVKGLLGDKWLRRTVLLCFIAAFLSIIVFIIQGRGILTVRGDFNEQEIPFTIAGHEILARLGFDSWAWNVDLGTSNVQGLGYYGLGTPFFYLAAIFPSKAIPYVLGWIFMLKYAIAGGTAYLYIRRMVKRPESAAVAAVFYAFSGFQTTNLIFYQFHDVVAFFPLMLLGLEMMLKNRKNRAVFIFAVCLNAFVNYYFFVQEAIFVVIYFLFRYPWKRGAGSFAKDVLNSLFSAVYGVCMSAVLFLPTILYIMQNQRSEGTIGIDKMFYTRYALLHVIKGWLMPAESMKNLSAIYPEQWNSVAGYLPLAGLVLAVAYVVKKRDRLSILLIILMFASFSPFLTSSFLLFTTDTQRWWFMFLLLLAMASARVLDDPKEYPVLWSAIGVSAATVILMLVVHHLDWKPEWGKMITYGRRFLLYGLIAIAGYLFLAFLHWKKRLNPKVLLPYVYLFAIGTTAVTLLFYRQTGAQTPAEFRERYELASALETIDPQYRYNTADNQLTLLGGISGTGSFSSTVSNGIVEFDQLFDYYLPYERMDKNIIPGLSALLGAKYRVMEKEYGNVVQEITTSSGRTYYVTESEACPIGYTVAHYQSLEDLMNLPARQRAVALLQAPVVQSADMSALNGYLLREEITGKNLKPQDVLIRQNSARAVRNFERTKKGFKCSVSMQQDGAAYFTVPYEDGFSAWIDGEKGTIVDSGGMMLIPMKAGEHEVELVFSAPGFKAGLVLSILAWCGFVLLILQRRKQKQMKAGK